MSKILNHVGFLMSKIPNHVSFLNVSILVFVIIALVFQETFLLFHPSKTKPCGFLQTRVWLGRLCVGILALLRPVLFYTFLRGAKFWISARRLVSLAIAIPTPLLSAPPQFTPHSPSARPNLPQFSLIYFQRALISPHFPLDPVPIPFVTIRQSSSSLSFELPFNQN